MNIDITPSGQACGASIRGVDLSGELSNELVSALREAWLKHHVISFPEQSLTEDQLERFSLAFGHFGEDTYIAPIPGRTHIIALRRRAQEKARLFAENWHTDWSFQEKPPAATCLYAITIPPVGGDTLFANQHLALEKMPLRLRSRLEGRRAIHSARGGYAPSGTYGKADQASDRSMDIRPSSSAMKTQIHPLIRNHPETREEGLFGCEGYIIGIEGMEDEEAQVLIHDLLEWQTQEQFIYRHKWQEGMLVMWDNRSVLHRATGGYEGYERLLHRTTIAGPA
ncbi:MAG: alpha-ketoglutarate-dependent taurine dioxygenase [Pseudohongiella sp.]|nr:MAG: alpha-ketoglutarate-dependent taurine dioxygenase [Pseudohongiella sp.]